MMPKEIELNPKEQSLIAIGASIAAGCQPCTAYHIKAARAAGACDRSIALALETSLAARNRATVAMYDWAERCQGARPEIDADFRAQKRLIAELTSIAAAVAVNSVPDLQTHLAAAQGMGARVDQIHVAIEIARKIKRAAEEQIETITGRIEKAVQPASTGAGPACCGSTQASQSGITAEKRPACQCR